MNEALIPKKNGRGSDFLVDTNIDFNGHLICSFQCKGVEVSEDGQSDAL